MVYSLTGSVSIFHRFILLVYSGKLQHKVYFVLEIVCVSVFGRS